MYPSLSDSSGEGGRGIAEWFHLVFTPVVCTLLFDVMYTTINFSDVA